MVSLCDLAVKYNVDRSPQWKGANGALAGHRYTPFYETLLKGRQIKRVLEFGIGSGGGLRMWAEYFPQAQVVGVDMFPELLFQADRIETHQCNQHDAEQVRALAEKLGKFDLIVDDGCHLWNVQAQVANRMVQYLNPGGVYVIEDVQRTTLPMLKASLRYKHEVAEFENPQVVTDDDRLVAIFQQALKLVAQPKVSCILTSYNRPTWVQRAIDSVKAQTFPEWELLVVDDGSGQKTVDTLKQVAKGDKRIKLLLLPREERGSVCRYAWAINYALEKITGDLVTYLTDDDYYLPPRFEKMVARLDDPSVSIVYGRQRVELYNKEGVHYRTDTRPTLGLTRDVACRLDHNSFMHRAACLAVLKKPYWPEHDWMQSDAEFLYKLALNWDFYPINEVLDVHSGHHEGIQYRMMRGESPIYTKEV